MITRADAAAPLLLSAMVGAMIAARFETGALCIGVAIVASLMAGARAPRRAWWISLGIGVAIAIALNLYLVAGQALPGPRVLGHAPTREGLRLGVLLALRMAGAMLAIHGLASAWPGDRAADELARLASPLRRLHVPVDDGRVVMALAIRFAPLVGHEARRIAALQAARAGRPARGAKERWTRLRAAVVPTMVSTLERADRVALALEARHYRSRAPAPPVRGVAPWRLAGVALLGTALLWRG